MVYIIVELLNIKRKKKKKYKFYIHKMIKYFNITRKNLKITNVSISNHTLTHTIEIQKKNLQY